MPDVRRLRGRSWGLLVILGVVFYAVTQGAIFLALTYVPAITLNLILSFTSVMVALAGILFLHELPERRQWLGIAISVIGALLFFYPAALNGSNPVGALVAFIGLSANTLSSILGRYVNFNLKLNPTVVTMISMGIGGLTLLVAGTLFQGLPSLSGSNWAIVIWLALVNSAFAFTLWNKTLKTLSAMESSVINNTMMIQIPILAWIFLEERPSGQQILGMALAAAGVFLVQVKRKP
jgi:drug/metabolite transporter (DMT)-like permease